MDSHRGVARFPRLLPILLATALCATGVIVFGGSQRASAGPNPVMFGYIPLPSDNMQLALETINAGASPTLRYTVGITNAASGSTMYYDQWEDGYEADIANPSQSTTLIFGDGNTSNGNAATYCAACTGDTLPQGAPLVMQNDIATPRNAANLFFDGGDKVASTRGFAITAGGFTTPLGSVLSMVVSAYDTTKYATDYTAPVGTDTPVPAGYLGCLQLLGPPRPSRTKRHSRRDRQGRRRHRRDDGDDRRRRDLPRQRRRDAGRDGPLLQARHGPRTHRRHHRSLRGPRLQPVSGQGAVVGLPQPGRVVGHQLPDCELPVQPQRRGDQRLQELRKLRHDPDQRAGA